MWHASVAKHHIPENIYDRRYLPSGLIPFAEWSALDVMRARQLLSAVLKGVGQPKHQIEEVPGKSLQWRRLVNDEERTIVGPAIDTR